MDNVKIRELAHELKLPLFNIKSFLETLYEFNFDLTETQRLEFLETANKETNRLLLLINNLVELNSTFSAGSMRFYNFSLTELIPQVANTYKLTAKNKGVIISYRSEKAKYNLCGNADLIAQVIHNLVGNSLRYTFKDTRVSIRTRAFVSIKSFLSVKNEFLNVSILDEGIGISRLRLNYINNDNEYINIKTSSGSVKGTCLGLPIVKRILHRHKSSLTILSQIHKGSIIGFSLLIAPDFKIAGEGT